MGRKSPGKDRVNKIVNTFDHLGKTTDRNILDPMEQMIKL